jgi:hypothetical protein
VYHRDAEHGHDGVADELLDRAAMPLQNAPRGSEVARYDLPYRLGVEAVAELGRSRDVGEDNGDGLAGAPLEERRGHERAAAGRAEARLLGPKLPTAPTHGHGASVRGLISEVERKKG